MNIVVCIKQVPDAANIRIDRERMTILRDGVESVINPLDRIALEAALDLKQKEGGKISVLTMGPSHSEEALRETIAAGADEAILLSDPEFAGADTLATSKVLARAISKVDPFPDLILCGRQTVDSDTGHVGPQLAEELDLPQVCGVTEIHVESNALVVKQLSDGFQNTYRVCFPALLTVSQGLNVPRHLPLGAVEQAFSKGRVIRWDLKELDLRPEEVGFRGSATTVLRLYKPPQKRRGEILSGSSQVLVKHLIAKLVSLSVLDEDETE
jgi:electron transfer flavoprotein beta subunit